jgi:hypothetical protein
MDSDRMAIEDDLAAIDRIDACEAFDQGRLSGAVISHQRGHLARIDREVDVMQNLDGSE